MSLPFYAHNHLICSPMLFYICSDGKIQIMELLDGKALSELIKTEITQEVSARIAQGLKRPHLAAVLIGDNPASQVYVTNKVKACEKVGFKSTLVKRGAQISQHELNTIIDELNENPDIDGFIVQLPLPKHLDETEVTLRIDYRKDVDGFHPMNLGRMTIGLPSFLPATPFGIMTMLDKYGIDAEGKDCVVLGRSNIVGTPISLLLSRKSKPGNATVILCHSKTRDIAYHCRQADILVVALGSPLFVTEDMVKPGAVVVDVGMNRINIAQGTKLVGDVDFERVAPKCSFITPVPGGVGPMTITSLLINTLKSARKEIYS